MVASYQVGEELQEERHNEQAYMQAIYVRICGYYYIVITQVVQSFFYVQCMLQQVELLILIHYFFGQSKRVQDVPNRIDIALYGKSCCPHRRTQRHNP